MAAVSVFVDEAVRGRLPMVCAKTGEPTETVIRMSRPIGSGVAGMAWLLVFLGPPGWVALFLVMILGPGAEHLTVRIREHRHLPRRITPMGDSQRGAPRVRPGRGGPGSHHRQALTSER